MDYRYEIPSETNYRNYTIPFPVLDLDPDGFTADEATGDAICEDVLEEAGLIAAPQWDTYGADGGMRLLYWDNEEDAENDDGYNAMGQILKTPED